MIGFKDLDIVRVIKNISSSTSHKFDSTFNYESILMKIYFNANIIKLPQRSLKVTLGQLFLRYLFCLKSDLSKFIMQIFHNMKFDLFITLTYVLMDNFCPCCNVGFSHTNYEERIIL